MNKDVMSVTGGATASYYLWTAKKITVTFWDSTEIQAQ